MGIEKTILLLHESVYLVNMNFDIAYTVKQCSTCLGDQNIQLQEKTTPYEVPAKLWEVVGTDIFMIYSKICCSNCRLLK